MIIYFDIETISDFKEEDPHWVSAKIKYWEKFSFMPEFNKIFTIAVWTVTKEWVVVKNLEWTEEEQINAFFKAIKKNYLCGFNIKWFDLPFIIKRALKYQIDIPDEIKFFWKKPWELEHIIDLQEVYKNWVFGAIWSLDLVCNFLWFKSPKEEWIDWSQVQEYFDSWKKEEIKEYCKRDVEATIKVYQYFKEYNLI